MDERGKWERETYRDRARHAQRNKDRWIDRETDRGSDTTNIDE